MGAFDRRRELADFLEDGQTILPQSPASEALLNSIGEHPSEKKGSSGSLRADDTDQPCGNLEVPSLARLVITAVTADAATVTRRDAAATPKCKMSLGITWVDLRVSGCTT